MSDPTAFLVREARIAMGLHSDQAFADFLGVSRRTVQRHAHTSGVPQGDGHSRLLRALHPLNPQLAQQLALALGKNLVQMGLEAPAPPRGAPQPLKPTRPEARREHAALVVVAAADALGMPPREARPVLAAIFSEARATGVDMDQLAKLLAEGEPAKSKKG
jgi:hypothetical protein